MKMKIKKTDILEVLYLDFLSKYEGALKDLAYRLEVKKQEEEGHPTWDKDRAKYIQLSEWRLEAYRDCLMRIKELKCKESKDL